MSSPCPHCDGTGRLKVLSDHQVEVAFDLWWAEYPKRSGGNPRRQALKAFRARLEDGVPSSDLLQGVKAYAAWCAATGKTGTELVKQARFWLSPNYEGWAQDWGVVGAAEASEQSSLVVEFENG